MAFYSYTRIQKNEYTGKENTKDTVFFLRDQVSKVAIDTDYDWGTITVIVTMKDGSKHEGEYSEFCQSFKQDFPCEGFVE